MRLRLTTGVTGAAVVVGAIWLGAPWLTLLALLGGGLAIREYYRLTPPGVGPMPVVLGVTAVAALLLAAEAASGRDFHLASGLVLAVWAFAALLWFIACYRGKLSGSEDSSGVEEFEANGATEWSDSLEDESPFDRLRTSRDPDSLGSYAGPGESTADGEPDDVGLYGDPDEDEFEPGRRTR